MMDEKAVYDLLENRLTRYSLQHLAKPLFQYLLLLKKWNTHYNLTAIRNLHDMVHKHILDSVAILPWLQGKRILDVGTGAGLPGIPLAIARPDLDCVLLDSNGKKIRFLKEVVRQLDLKNVEMVQSRVENYQPNNGFDTVLSRAFSSLTQMIDWTKHLIAANGVWLAMKGRYPNEELEGLTYPHSVFPYTVEGVEGERCSVIITNQIKE